MKKFSEFYSKKESFDPETNKPMTGNSASIEDGQNMGYGQKRMPVEIFERATGAAKELLESLEELNQQMPDKDNTLDIDKVTTQVKGLLDNLQALSSRLDGDSPPSDDSFGTIQTSQSIV